MLLLQFFLFKKSKVSFSYVCPVIDHKFRHNIFIVVCGFDDEIHDQ